jgi:hypothetical protein
MAKNDWNLCASAFSIECMIIRVGEVYPYALVLHFES